MEEAEVIVALAIQTLNKAFLYMSLIFGGGYVLLRSVLISYSLNLLLSLAVESIPRCRVKVFGGKQGIVTSMFYISALINNLLREDFDLPRPMKNR